MKIVTALLLLISLPLFAQVNFESGYFINNNDIKTKCLIRNIGWVNNPTKFEYKINNSDNSNFKSISEIKEFSIDSSCTYKRFELKIDKASNNINDIGVERNPTWSEETLFLKVIVEGDINLYEYNEPKINSLFISSGNHESVEQLVYKEYLKGNNEIGKNYYFRQQLFNVLKSENLNINDFKNIEYTKKDIIALLFKHSATKDGTPINLEPKRKSINYNLKITTGINFTSFKIQDRYPFGDVAFDTKSVLAMGIECEFVLPFKKNKWTFFINPNYQSYIASAKFEENIIAFNNRFIEIPIGIRHYLFLKNDFKIFINVGFTTSYSFNSTITINSNTLDVYNQSYNFIGGVGLNKGKFSIQLRYSSDRDIIKEINISKYTSLGVQLGYRFL